MSKTVIGADKVRAKLARLKRAVTQEMAKANRHSGEDLVRVAKVLHPGDGATRDAIRGQAEPDGSYRVNFGPKAKVTEGENAPRPFVNPAKKALEKKMKARASRAINRAVKASFNG